MALIDRSDAPLTNTSGVSHGLTSAVALVGGTLAVAAVGGGIGVVGAFGAVGIGAVEIFTGGALLSGAAAHTAQKKLARSSQSEPAPRVRIRFTEAEVPSKPKVDWDAAMKRSASAPSTSVTSAPTEIDDLRSGRF